MQLSKSYSQKLRVNITRLINITGRADFLRINTLLLVLKLFDVDGRGRNLVRRQLILRLVFNPDTKKVTVGQRVKPPSEVSCFRFTNSSLSKHDQPASTSYVSFVNSKLYKNSHVKKMSMSFFTQPSKSVIFWNDQTDQSAAMAKQSIN